MDGLKSNLKLLIYADIVFMVFGNGLCLYLSDSPLLFLGTVLVSVISTVFILLAMKWLMRKMQDEAMVLQKCLEDVKFSVELLNEEIRNASEQRCQRQSKGLINVSEQLKDLVVTCLAQVDGAAPAGMVAVAKELGKLCLETRKLARDDSWETQSEKLLLITENLSLNMRRLAKTLDAPVPEYVPPLKSNSLRKAIRAA